MAITIDKLQSVIDNQVKVLVVGPNHSGKFRGLIKVKGQDGKILIQSHLAFDHKVGAKEAMDKVVITIKNIKVNMAKGALPINTLIKISNLLGNKE